MNQGNSLYPNPKRQFYEVNLKHTLAQTFLNATTTDVIISVNTCIPVG